MVNLYPMLFSIRLVYPIVYTFAVTASVAALMLTATQSFAASSPDLRDANRCTRYFKVYEKKFNIPAQLLKAISINESGRWHSKEKQRVAWPWTLNVAGKGFYFDSKNEALQTVKSHVRAGAKSYDVGCMQINMHYHGKAFRNLNQAFDPRFNVAYAASLLRSHYDANGSWDIAVAHYHSKTQSKGTKYAERVRKIWHNLRKTAYHTPQPPRVRRVASLQQGFSRGAYPVSARKPVLESAVD